MSTTCYSLDTKPVIELFGRRELITSKEKAMPLDIKTNKVSPLPISYILTNATSSKEKHPNIGFNGYKDSKTRNLRKKTTDTQQIMLLTNSEKSNQLSGLDYLLLVDTVMLLLKKMILWKSILLLLK